MKKNNVKELIRLIFKAVTLAMGVAVVALSIMNKLDTQTAVTMLGIGVAGSGVALLMDKNS
ncbi:MAG: hypothetical protein IJD93_09595 [Ruminococcus sp.]|nr:hypothetical protein [Ruminococcus sp.]MBQ2972520.1 hypothetical protein [Ruminococcus sp.]